MTFELTILGSNSAIPTSKRYPTAQVLNVSERFFLIDCGEGTQIQLRNNSIGFGKINNIFISHIHGDHIFGIFGLLSTFNLLGRKKRLTIHGGGELNSIINFFIENFVDDLSYEIEVKVINERNKIKIFEDKLVEVYSFPLKHRINCFGFLFQEKKKLRNIDKEYLKEHPVPVKYFLKLKQGEDVITEDDQVFKYEDYTYESSIPRSYAYCSDTSYYESLKDYINGVDLLFHESTFLESEIKIAKQTGHSTAKQAAKIAQLVNAKQLILGHFSARYPDVKLYEEEAKEIFSNTIAVNDGDVFKVPMVFPKS